MDTPVSTISTNAYLCRWERLRWGGQRQTHTECRFYWCKQDLWFWSLYRKMGWSGPSQPQGWGSRWVTPWRLPLWIVFLQRCSLGQSQRPRRISLWTPSRAKWGGKKSLGMLCRSRSISWAVPESLRLAKTQLKLSSYLALRIRTRQSKTLIGIFWVSSQTRNVLFLSSRIHSQFNIGRSVNRKHPIQGRRQGFTVLIPEISLKTLRT